jgi:ABC-type Fe3+ transport system substrate-binding protein
LIGSGEVPMSPTIFDANVAIAKQKGSPVEWRPLEPVVTTVGSSALMAKAPNPYTALLFIDFLLSKEGQQLIIKGGLWSPREDIGTVEQKFKKTYLDEKYSLEELEANIYAVGKFAAPTLYSKEVGSSAGRIRREGDNVDYGTL